MKEKQEIWSDPILDEIHGVREEMAKKLKKDRKGFFEKLRQDSIGAGVVYADLKPLPFPPKKRNG